MYRLWLCLVLALAVLPRYTAAEPGEVHRAHAIAMHGEPKYGPDFTHFDYVNPQAPKGGRIVLSTTGSFDSLHPFILKGQAAVGVGNLFETLMTGSADEAFSEYGLLAETISWPEDRSWVAFTLRPEARWHDGKPVTVEDVIWSLDILKTEGHPFYRSYYANVAQAEKTDERTVKFTFSGPPNRELPLITGQLPILPKHYWEGRTFAATTLEPPVGSGPYRIQRVDPGRSITYERDPTYWGKDLPVNRGKDNVDTMRYDYYRDGGVAREAFKAGAIDFFNENVAKDWATSYTVPAVDAGLIIKREIPHENPQGMQAYVFNTRREIFQDRRVREAINQAFDFEWTNQNLFHGAYRRSTSFFANSELAASGLPSDAEVAILQPFRDQLPDELFTQAFTLPKSDGTGDIRSQLRQALRLLKSAGWENQAGKLTQTQTGRVMRFEILHVSPAFERITLPFVKNLQRLGIEATVRTVDTAQYQQRLDTYDFDMIVHTWGQSLSPGNEQRNFWHSEAAAVPGTQNLAGIREPVVDSLIDLVIAAPDRDSLITRTRALDRVLLWGYYVVPQWHISAYRVLYWDKFGIPDITPKYSLGFDTWWIDPEREARLAQRKGAVR
jgi:microcin C transport system substrate-binding protein